MRTLLRGIPHCPRCGRELEGGEEQCPHCGFNPRQFGFQLALALLIASVALILLAVVSVYTVPAIGSYLLLGAFLLFPLAGIVVLVSFVVTPARLGTIDWR